jgi:CheY-like chemotaxis protein
MEGLGLESGRRPIRTVDTTARPRIAWKTAAALLPHRPSVSKLSYNAIVTRHGAPIIVVEDSPDDAFFVRDALAKAHIANPLIIFQTADHARQHFDESHRVDLPALFIVDVNLIAGETGIDFLRWLRQQRAPLGSTPTMMLTGSTRPEDRDQADLLGSVYFLLKPVSADTVTSAVQSLGFVVSNLAPDFTVQRTIERRL